MKAFKDDCVELQINYKDTLASLERSGVLVAVDNKRMTKGSKISIDAFQTRCIILDAGHQDFLDMEPVVDASIASADDEDASGES